MKSIKENKKISYETIMKNTCLTEFIPEEEE